MDILIKFLGNTSLYVGKLIATYITAGFCSVNDAIEKGHQLFLDKGFFLGYDCNSVT